MTEHQFLPLDRPVPTAARLISRHSSELSLSGLAIIERFLPEAGDAGTVALAILRTCLPDWIGQEGLRRPAALNRGATIKGTATSLGHPFSTVHRLVGRLRERGLIEAVGDTVAITKDEAWATAVLAFLKQAHDVFLRFAGELHDAEQLDLSLHVCTREPTILAIVSTALDCFLMPFEMFSGRFGDWTSKKLWLVLSTLCVRHVTIDPVLNARYAYTSTPDHERRPVPSAVLCALAGTSTTTGWRHCKAMAKAGIITEARQGWVLCTQELLDARTEAAVQGAVAFYRRRIEELMVKGFDPANPGYIQGCPPLVAYDPLPALVEQGAT